MLYIFGGLPGTGKTELSKYLASTVNATHIRIDTIEQALRNSGISDLYDEGYKVAFALTLENLKNGRTVIADSTNPVSESRQSWIDIANQAGSPFIEVEIVCSNKSEHRQRLESRQSDIPNLVLPAWESVISREYQPWNSANIILDTSGKTPEYSKKELINALSGTSY